MDDASALGFFFFFWGGVLAAHRLHRGVISVDVDQHVDARPAITLPRERGDVEPEKPLDTNRGRSRSTSAEHPHHSKDATHGSGPARPHHLLSVDPPLPRRLSSRGRTDAGASTASYKPGRWIVTGSWSDELPSPSATCAWWLRRAYFICWTTVGSAAGSWSWRSE